MKTCKHKFRTLQQAFSSQKQGYEGLLQCEKCLKLFIWTVNEDEFRMELSHYDIAE